MMRRVLMALLMACAACSGDDIAGSSTTTGSYTLRTINGSPLPYTVVGGSVAGTVIISDVISLYQGGTFAESIQFRGSASGPVEGKTRTGTFSLFGTSITLQINETGTTRVAKGDGTTMTFIEDGLTSVYRK